MKNLLLSVLALGALFVPVVSNSMFGRAGQRALPILKNPRVLGRRFTNLPVGKGVQSTLQDTTRNLDNIERRQRAIMKLPPNLIKPGLISLRDQLRKIQESLPATER